jgi:hypothetical protein
MVNLHLPSKLMLFYEVLNFDFTSVESFEHHQFPSHLSLVTGGSIMHQSVKSCLLLSN